MVVMTVGECAVSNTLFGCFILLITLHRINQVEAWGATWGPLRVPMTLIDISDFFVLIANNLVPSLWDDSNSFLYCWRFNLEVAHLRSDVSQLSE